MPVRIGHRPPRVIALDALAAAREHASHAADRQRQRHRHREHVAGAQAVAGDRLGRLHTEHAAEQCARHAVPAQERRPVFAEVPAFREQEGELRSQVRARKRSAVHRVEAIVRHAPLAAHQFPPKERRDHDARERGQRVDRAADRNSTRCCIKRGTVGG